jgi:uncharacterized integral membrane protein
MSTHNNYTVKRMLFKSKEKKKRMLLIIVIIVIIIIIIFINYKPTRLMCFVHLNLEPMCGVTIGATP